jgi:S-methylmethionine-dependent homocysteine/selenocysteine methylase
VAMLELVATGRPHVGGYANTFGPVPVGWTLDGGGESDGLIPTRDDLDADAYATHAQGWLNMGATVIGGCCGTGPAHTARQRRLIDEAVFIT